MFDKILKNPKVMGWVAIFTLILLVAYIWDDKKNPDKDFYGLLKSTSTTTAA